MTSSRPIARKLAAILSGPVSERDRGRAALHVVDWLGCAAAGAVTEPGRVLLTYAQRLAPGPCRAVGGGELQASEAAFVNGSVGNVLEMDDIFRTSLVHPGPVVVPTSLALAAELGASGRASFS